MNFFVSIAIYIGFSVVMATEKEMSSSNLERESSMIQQSTKSSSEPTIFNPLVTMSARTTKPLTLSLQRSPGMNIGSSFLLSSINVGVFPRLELGTSPAFYFVDEHKWNINLKLHFWKSDVIDWSIIYSRTDFEANLGTGEKANLLTNTTGLVFNLHWSHQKWMLSSFVNRICSYLDSSNHLNFIYSFDCRDEVGVDLQWTMERGQWLTLGTAKLRETGINAYSPLHGGYGVAWTKEFTGKMFSRPTVGIYYVPATKDVLYLLTTTFY